jgi:hypothetical protein
MSPFELEARRCGNSVAWKARRHDLDSCSMLSKPLSNTLAHDLPFLSLTLFLRLTLTPIQLEPTLSDPVFLERIQHLTSVFDFHQNASI